jgi:hypothetical protein
MISFLLIDRIAADLEPHFRHARDIDAAFGHDLFLGLIDAVEENLVTSLKMLTLTGRTYA